MTFCGCFIEHISHELFIGFDLFCLESVIKIKQKIYSLFIV